MFVVVVVIVAVLPFTTRGAVGISHGLPQLGQRLNVHPGYRRSAPLIVTADAAAATTTASIDLDNSGSRSSSATASGLITSWHVV
jgi:hypothetical protein